jgi:hypothetical protein
MPKQCSICAHPELQSINKLLVDNASSNRVIARQFSVGHDAVQRHRQNHLAASLVKAREVEKAADATTLLQQVQELLQQARRLTDAAEHAKDLRTALTGCRAIGSVLELLGKVSGQLTSQINVRGNIAIPITILSPEENERRIAELLAKGGIFPTIQ